METLINSWTEGIPLSRQLAVLQQNILPGSGYKLDENLMAKALSHYLGMKEDPKYTSCYRCGHYPAIIIMDAIRKIAFDLDSKDIEYGSDKCYKDFIEMKKDASMKAMMNGFIEKGTKTAELKPYGLKTYFSLPHM